MADVRLSLNDVLCFAVSKFGKIALKSLKSALSDFYDVDVLSAAKLLLLKDVDGLNLLVKRPHIPQRRDGDARLTREVEDIVSLFVYLDEQKAIDKLPRYVSGNPDNMPSVRLYEGDLNIIMSTLKNFGGKFEQIQAVLVAICRDVQDLQVNKSRGLPQSSASQFPARATNKSSVQGVGQPTVAVTHGNTTAETETTSAIENDQLSDGGAVASTMDWATLVSTPICSENRFAALSTDDDDHHQQQDPYTTVVNSRRKRTRQRTAQQQQQQQQQQRQQEPAAVRQQQPVSARRAPTVFGKSKPASGSTITAAKILRKKAVFCVDNVNTSCTVDNMRSFVSSLSVEVMNCFEAKPRRRRNESAESNVDRKAFRICICEDDRQRFLNPAVWPDSISISDWFFKESAGEDKRRRIHISGDNRSGTVQSVNAVSAAVDRDVEAATGSAECDMTTTTTSDDTILAAYDTNRIHDGDC